MKRKLANKTDELRSFIKPSLLLFLFLFLLVKGNTFLSPLLLANVYSVEEYGLVEFALSIAMTLSGFFHLGLGNAYAYFNLQKKDGSFNSIIILHGLVVCFIGAVVAMILFWGITSASLKLVFSVQLTVLFACQMILSSIHKADDAPNMGILLDGGVYFSFLLLVLVNFFLPLTISWLVFFFGLYQAILLVFLVYFWMYKSDRQIAVHKLKEVYSYGLGIFISGVFMFALTVGARIIIENQFGASEVGYYSFYFRLASATVLIHQAATIFFFKKLYTSPLSRLDTYFSLFVFLIFILGILLWYLLPLLLQDRIPFLGDSIERYRELYLILSLQIPFWIAMALLESIVYRERISKGFAIWLGVVIGLALISLAVLKYGIGISSIVVAYVNIAACYLVVEGQIMLIRRKTQVEFRKMRLLLLSIFGFVTTIILYLSI